MKAIPSTWRWGLASALGVALTAAPAWTYRFDRVRCDAWPDAASHAWMWIAFLAGLAILTASWLRVAADDTPRLRTVIVAGALPHVVALFVPMFLSEDPLFYAAIGHAAA